MDQIYLRCKQCGQLFIKDARHRRYCSKECRELYQKSISYAKHRKARGYYTSHKILDITHPM